MRKEMRKKELKKEIRKYLQNECRTYQSEVRVDVLINKEFYDEDNPNMEDEYEKIFNEVVDSIYKCK